MDVARQAGVSKTAVSFALNGTGSVAEETRQRVLDAARELNYQPSMVARGLRMRRTGTVGVLVPDLFGPFFFALYAGVEEALGSEDYICFLGNANGDLVRQQNFLHRLLGWNVDGVIFAPLVDHRRDRPSFSPPDGTPVVFADRGPEVAGVAPQAHASVCSNNLEAAREATMHLLGCAAGPVGFIGPDAATGPVWSRRLGYRQALEEAGQPAREAVGRVDSRELGQTLAARMLDGAAPVRALFAATNPCGLGAYLAIRARGLKVPEDVCLAVFDDADWAQVADVTAVRTDPYQMGTAAATALLGLLRDQPLADRQIIVPAKLVVRGSTAG